MGSICDGWEMESLRSKPFGRELERDKKYRAEQEVKGLHGMKLLCKERLESNLESGKINVEWVIPSYLGKSPATTLVAIWACWPQSRTGIGLVFWAMMV